MTLSSHTSSEAWEPNPESNNINADCSISQLKMSFNFAKEVVGFGILLECEFLEVDKSLTSTVVDGDLG